MRRIVIPGELISETPLRILDTIVENNKTYSTIIGLFDDEKKTLIPLEGLWYPNRDDLVIGIIEESKLNTDIVILNAPYKGLIISKYSEGNMKTGDVIEANVKELDKTGTVILTRPRVLRDGKVIRIKPSKVNRLLGKNNTMINQISEGTKTKIIVGLNGLIWLNGGNLDLAIKAIETVCSKAHTSGLTEKIGKMVNINGAQKAVSKQDKNKVEEEMI
ncbi:MAG: KH domain-containing protein [Candidatus Micrarchaeia archaeon]